MAMKPDETQRKPEEHHTKWSIHIDKKQYFATVNPITGAELKSLANITGDFDLFKVVPGQGDDIKVADAEQVELKNGDHFYSIPRTLNPGGLDATA